MASTEFHTSTTKTSRKKIFEVPVTVIICVMGAINIASESPSVYMTHTYLAPASNLTQVCANCGDVDGEYGVSFTESLPPNLTNSVAGGIRK